jgi:hypothetical protein
MDQFEESTARAAASEQCQTHIGNESQILHITTETHSTHHQVIYTLFSLNNYIISSHPLIILTIGLPVTKSCNYIKVYVNYHRPLIYLMYTLLYIAANLIQTQKPFNCYMKFPITPQQMTYTLYIASHTLSITLMTCHLSSVTYYYVINVGSCSTNIYVKSSS